MKKERLALCAALSATILTMSACSSPDSEESTSPSSAEASHAHAEHDDDHDGEHSHDGFEAAEGETEVALSLIHI